MFMRTTMVPRMTRKIRIPTCPLSDREAMNPSLNMVVYADTTLKLVIKSAAVTIPMNREL